MQPTLWLPVASALRCHRLLYGGQSTNSLLESPRGKDSAVSATRFAECLEQAGSRMQLSLQVRLWTTLRKASWHRSPL